MPCLSDSHLPQTLLQISIWADMSSLTFGEWDSQCQVCAWLDKHCSTSFLRSLWPHTTVTDSCSAEQLYLPHDIAPGEAAGQQLWSWNVAFWDPLGSRAHWKTLALNSTMSSAILPSLCNLTYQEQMLRDRRGELNYQLKVVYNLPEHKSAGCQILRDFGPIKAVSVYY